MRILIAFYSKTGGTEKISQALREEFAERGHSVEVEKILPQKERSFWQWWWLRMVKGDCDIRPPKVRDVSKFDLICIGSPNWTRLSLPISRYLEEVKGLRHKNVGFFSSSFLPPLLARFVLSAYLLEMTSSWRISNKGGKVIDFLLLSSFFKKWSLASEEGKKLIKNFCDKLEAPLSSLKKYFLELKEIENTRFLVILFSLILIASFLLQILSSALGRQFLAWPGFFIIIAVEIFVYFIILTILTSRSFIPLGKYLAGLALVFGATTAIMLLLPSTSSLIVLSYIFVVILFIFFRDLKTIFFVGAVVLLAYFYLYYAYPLKEILSPRLDLPFILLYVVIAGFIAKNLQDRFLSLLEAQEEIETAKAVLEIKVEARTRELKELSASLEEQVIERTSSLREKIADLERFNKLTVGREIKMIELKEEIARLKKELPGRKKGKKSKTNNA